MAWTFSWQSATPISPRQIGVVFGVPLSVGSSLAWSRVTPPWVTARYPSSHIGRPTGSGVTPRAGDTPALNVSREGVDWSADASPLGCADFRSTKHNVTTFTLGEGDAALSFLSNGTQHGRAWIDSAAGSAFLLAAVHSCEGGNPFSRERVLPQPTFSQGSLIEGSVFLSLGQPRQGQ